MEVVGTEKGESSDPPSITLSRLAYVLRHRPHAMDKSSCSSFFSLSRAFKVICIEISSIPLVFGGFICTKDFHNSFKVSFIFISIIVFG